VNGRVEGGREGNAKEDKPTSYIPEEEEEDEDE
jgi:hypothetical protein